MFLKQICKPLTDLNLTEYLSSINLQSFSKSELLGHINLTEEIVMTLGVLPFSDIIGLHGIIGSILSLNSRLFMIFLNSSSYFLRISYPQS